MDLKEKDNNNNSGEVVVNPKFILLVTSVGGLVIELFNEKSPESISRFLEQVNLHRYNDTLIHRVIKNLFIQTGRFSLNTNSNSLAAGTPLSTQTSDSKDCNPSLFSRTNTFIDTSFFNEEDEEDGRDCDGATNDLEISDDKEKVLPVGVQVDPEFRRLMKESRQKFNQRALVGLGKYSQLIISLDSSDALNDKFLLIGRIHPSTFSVLNKIEAIPTNEDNSPIEPILITDAHVLSNFHEELTPAGDASSDPSAHTSSVSSTPKIFDQTPVKRGFNNSFSLNDSYHPASVTKTPFDSTPVLKRLKTKLMTGMIRTPSSARVHDDSHSQLPFMAHNTDFHKPLGLNRSLSMPYINGGIRVKPKWPTRLVIVRHGQSEQNAQLDLPNKEDIDTILTSSVRDADIALTQLGRWQSQQTGRYLATTSKFDICFSSPYVRAIDTADEIIKQLPYKLKRYSSNWLREKEFGRWHGLTEQAVKEHFPEEYKIRIRDGKYWYKMPSGENYCDVEERVHSFLEKLSRDYAGRCVLVVTHQVPYKLFRSLFQHLDEKGVLALENVHNCGIQEYVLDTTKAADGRMKLKHFNYKPYDLKDLPDNLKDKPKQPK